MKDACHGKHAFAGEVRGNAFVGEVRGNLRGYNGQDEGTIWQLAASYVDRATWTTATSVWTSFICDCNESASEEKVEEDRNPRGNSRKVELVLAEEEFADQNGDGVEDLR